MIYRISYICAFGEVVFETKSITKYFTIKAKVAMYFRTLKNYHICYIHQAFTKDETNEYIEIQEAKQGIRGIQI